MSATPDYRVALEAYNGPLDLLLFLIKQDEVDIYDIPIARITEQYLEYAEVIKQLDPETAGQFLVLAATLMELKSRMLLPKPPIEEDGEDDSFDPRLELVRQLLEYKKFKDAARTLDTRAQEQAQKFPRKPSLPQAEEEETEIANLDVWNLFEAFNSLLKQIGAAGYTHKVGVDDTPIALHAEDVLDSLERAGGTQRFEEVFAGRDRAELIGLFLALLELIRQQRIRVTQDRPFAPITIVMLDRTPLDAVSEFDANEEDENPADAERPFSLSPIDDEPVEENPADDELAAIERALDEFTTSDDAQPKPESSPSATPAGDLPPTEAKTEAPGEKTASHESV